MNFIVSVDPLTGGITLLMAIGLIAVGVWQIGRLREQIIGQLRSSQDQMRIIIQRSHASLLPQIDARMDCTELEESKRKERDLLMQALDECADLSGRKKEAEVRACFAKYVEQWKRERAPDYEELMRKCYFFETVGFMCSRGYLSVNDIAELYGMPILRTYLLLESHIEDRQQHEGRKLLENFVKLAYAARQLYPKYEVQDSL